MSGEPIKRGATGRGGQKQPRRDIYQTGTSQKAAAAATCRCARWRVRLVCMAANDRHARLEGKRIGETSFFSRRVRRDKIARQIPPVPGKTCPTENLRPRPESSRFAENLRITSPPRRDPSVGEKRLIPRASVDDVVRLTRGRPRCVFSATRTPSRRSYSRDAALTKRSKRLRRCFSDLGRRNRGFFLRLIPRT